MAGAGRSSALGAQIWGYGTVPSTVLILRQHKGPKSGPMRYTLLCKNWSASDREQIHPPVNFAMPSCYPGQGTARWGTAGHGTAHRVMSCHITYVTSHFTIANQIRSDQAGGPDQVRSGPI